MPQILVYIGIIIAALGTVGALALSFFLLFAKNKQTTKHASIVIKSEYVAGNSFKCNYKWESSTYIPNKQSVRKNNNLALEICDNYDLNNKFNG